MCGDALEEPVEVGAGESPVERCGGGVVAGVEGQHPFGECVEVGEVVGGEDLALDACTGRCTSWAVGQAAVIRSIEVCPRCEVSLSTTQNTRSALA